MSQTVLAQPVYAGITKRHCEADGISQPTSLSIAIQWAEHVDVATRTYSGAGPSKTIGGSSLSGNRGGHSGGQNFGWRGGNKSGYGNYG